MNSLKKILSAVLGGVLIMTSIFGGVSASALQAPGSSSIAYKAATEGMVLLKNDNSVLPIQGNKTVSVFGRTQIDTVKGGTGSGNVLVDYRINILKGLRNRGDIKINEDLANIYEEWCARPENSTGEEAAGSIGLMGGDTSYPEMPLTDAQVAAAATKTDMAIVTIGRITHESTDRSITNPEDKDVGDYNLSKGEKAMLQKVTQYFDKVAVVLNIGGVIDMKWVEEYNVDSVLVMWQAGMEQGYAVADILSGKVNPSGKLVDTFPINYSDVRAQNFGIGVNNPVYEEDIFVGYRYFETFNVPVKYEFGFGLSYTTFAQKVVGFKADDETVKVDVRVTNTGTVAGKEVVQVYYGAPQGLLGKSTKSLAAYGKTDLLAPGQSQVLTIKYDTTQMASYDDSGKIQKSAYVMEAGDYPIYAGSSVKKVVTAGTYSLNSTKVIQQLTEQLAPITAFNRLKADGSYEAAPQRTVPYADTNFDIPALIPITANQGYKLIDVYNGTCTMEQFIAQMPQADLIKLTRGLGMDLDLGSWYIKELPSDCTTGAAGGFGYQKDVYGIPAVTTADGPAGVRIDKEVNGGTTAFPIGILLACTWNEDLLEEVGDAIGKDCAINRVDSWLAPALNIHRNPLCGRNFEYYSEDPVVSGITAAAITKGVQANGVGVTLKHFAANNQETNRNAGDSTVSERALREIYLKGFEIAVKTAKPWFIMSSYNKINGYHGASNYDLTTSVLRKEWGFVGTVMTDWLPTKNDGDASMIRAQNDLAMPGGMLNASTLQAGLTAGKVTLAEVQRCGINILNSTMKTLAFGRANNLTDNGSYSAGDPWSAVQKSNVAKANRYSVQNGKIVTIPIIIDANGSISGGQGVVQYDKELLKLESMTGKSGFSFQASGDSFNFATGSKAISGEVIVGYAVFSGKAADDDIDTMVTFDLSKTYNADIKPVTALAQNAVITVLSETPIRGDINLDGKVDLEDAILLMQYLSENVTLSNRQLRAADVSNDGAVNVGDAIIILQMCLN